MSGILILVFGIALLTGFGWLLVSKRADKTFSPGKAKIGVVNGSILSVMGLLMILIGKPRHGDAVSEVLLSIPDSDSSVHNYLTGSLADGVAVVVNDSAGYWVKDDQVYVVNDEASQLSPGISFAPEGVTWLKVEKAAR